jgi:hypothetical protein
MSFIDIAPSAAASATAAPEMPEDHAGDNVRVRKAPRNPPTSAFANSKIRCDPHRVHQCRREDENGIAINSML